MKIYIVIGSKGEHDDYSEWIDKVFIKKENAKKYKEFYDFRIEKIPQRIERLNAIISGFDDDPNKWSNKQMNFYMKRSDLLYDEYHKAKIEEHEIWDDECVEELLNGGAQQWKI